MKLSNKPGVQTIAVHGGEAPDPTTGASAPAIHMSSTFVGEEPLGFSAHDIGPDSPFAYGRWANPTVDMLDSKIAALEGMEACLATASGMAAATDDKAEGIAAFTEKRKPTFPGT